MNSGFSEPSGRYRSAPNAHLPSVPRMEFPTSRSMRMMTSVSMLPRMMGAAIAVRVLNGFGMSAPHRSDVGNGAGDGGCSRPGRACQMGTRPRALAADKIAVGGRDRALAGRNRFAVGGKTHRASRLAPFEACIGKDFVEPFGDRITLDGFRARHDPGTNARGHLAAARDLGGGPQIAEPAVGARPDENPIDRC